MYTPKLNREDNLPTLQHFVRENPLCTFVTQTAHGMVASHIPMVLDEGRSGFGTLHGHVARANSQWKDLDPSTEALGIFTGPQHFISASWYPDKSPDGKEVPTWNYVAVHAYGHIRVVDDADWLLEHLRALTDRSEVIARVPWKISDAPEDFIAKLTGRIVGLELPVSRVEGKWKVSQNRSERDAEGVIEGLDTLGTPESETMKDLIRSHRPER